MTDTPIASPPRTLSRAGTWALTLTATLTLTVSYVDRQALAAIAPTVTKAFDISEPQYGWLVSAFSIAYLVGAPAAGFMIDRVGARRGLLAAVLVWSIVAASHSLITGFLSLFIMRLLLGLAESPSFPGAAQTVQRALPPKDRARGFGILFTGSSIGAMIAGPLATWLAHRWGYRAAFIGVGAAGLVWVPLWLYFAWRRPARDVLDAHSPTPEATSPAPARPSLLTVATHPAVLRGVLAILAAAPAIGFILNWSSKYLVAAHGMSQADVGPYLAIPPLLFDAGSILFGNLASERAHTRQRGAPDRPLFAIAALLALSMALVPFGKTPLQSMIVGGVGMAGGGGVYALLTSDMLSRVQPSVVGSAASLGASAQSVAHIISAPLIGMLIKSTGGYTIPFVVLGLWLIPGCAAWLLWTPPPPPDERAA